MTPKQSLFVEEFLVDMNATQTAIRAGYSAKTAYSIGQENLKKPEIAVAIAEAQAERSERTLIDADMVVTGLLAEAQNTGDGASHSARVSAWAHLGKHFGMFKDQVDMNHGVRDTMAEVMKQISGSGNHLPE